MERPDRNGAARRRPTLRDVAALSGTSIKTVSRVINGEGGVRAELASRVREAVAELGYLPDDRARALRNPTVSTGTIGLIQFDVANPFSAAMFKGVEDVASGFGHVVLTASSRAERPRFDEIVGTFRMRRVDGLIVVPVGDDIDTLEDEASLGTPIVFVDQAPSRLIGDLVASDHFGGARQAVAHLIAHGHERIGFVGDDLALHSARERKRGWEEAHRDAGLPIDSSLVQVVGDGSEVAESAVRRMIVDLAPTAIFTAQNLISIGAIRALADLGLRHTIAHVGFDDVELGELLSPGLTVAPQDPVSLGRRAAEILFARLAGDTEPHKTIQVPVDLVERGSGEIRPNS